MSAGEFSPAARAAILEAGGGRCVGCGRPDPETQHRRARGMGGTSDAAVGQAVNGVPLCGPNPRGCHGWAEAHPLTAELLGWRARDASAPWWSRYGWRRWVLVDGTPLVEYVDDAELDQPADRGRALEEWRRWRAGEDQLDPTT